MSTTTLTITWNGWPDFQPGMVLLSNGLSAYRILQVRTVWKDKIGTNQITRYRVLVERLGKRTRIMAKKMVNRGALQFTWNKRKGIG